MSRLVRSLGRSFHVSKTQRVLGVLEIKVLPKADQQGSQHRSISGLVTPEHGIILRRSWGGLDRLLFDDSAIRRDVKEKAASSALYERLNVQGLKPTPETEGSISADISRFSVSVKPTIALSFDSASFDEVQEIIADNVPLERAQRYLRRAAATMYHSGRGRLKSVTIAHAPNFDVVDLAPIKGILDLDSELALSQLP